MERTLPALSVLLFQLPLYLAWLVGILLAIINWKKHTKVSLLVVIALGLSLIQSVAGTILSVLLPVMLAERNLPISRIGMLMGINSLVGNLIHVIVWVLILIAIFGWRKQAAGQA